VPFVTRKGVRVHYEVESEGPPIVALPGLGYGFERALMDAWTRALPPHLWIWVNPRGHGPSDKPRDRAAHAIQEYRDDVLAVLDALAVPKVVCMGFSDGGPLAYAVADAYPSRVVGVVDYDGIDGRDMCDDEGKQSRIGYAQTVREKGWNTDIRELARESGVAEDSAVLKGFWDPDPEMVTLELEAWTDWKGPFSVLPEIRVPVLVLLNGTRDQSEIECIQGNAHGVHQVRVVPGTNHMTLCTDFLLSADIVREFLQRVEA